MTVQQLLQNDVLPLQMEDAVHFALGLMDELKVRELPVNSGDIFRGLLREDRLEQIADESLSLQAALLNPEPLFIGQDRSLHHALRIMHSGELSLLPVLDENGLYCGYLSAEHLFHELGGLLSADVSGGVLVLEMAAEDYQLSEIAQIMETNDLKILNVTVRPVEMSTRIEVMLKTQSRDLSRALQTLARYEYKVQLAEFEDVHDLQLNERYELLMKMLEI